MVRTSSLEAYDIIQKCMYKYWEKGINSFSFNSIISYSGASKPTIYRLIGDENTLKNNFKESTQRSESSLIICFMSFIFKIFLYLCEIIGFA